MIGEPLRSKIGPDHLRRQAVVYIRQSSAHQVRNNRESSERQYALAQRAESLGWLSKSIQTIDDDQGRSGTSSAHRQGFKNLLAEIGAGQVGIILALEASRLARSSADWHRLVEICVVTKTLLADESAVYDPRDPNDRLLLGVKGTISEAELFTLRCRLHDGRWNKARRGELARSLPVGYMSNEEGEVIKHTDRQVQSRLNYIFRLFAQRKVARRVLLQLIKEKLKIPSKIWGGPQHGNVIWKEPDLSDLMRILHNPIYAGAYVYGEKEYDSFDRSTTNGKAKVRQRSVEDWPVCIKGACPAYITWEQFMNNRRVLRSNWYRAESRGAPRKGAALLQGIVYCGRCGARMTVLHYATKEQRSPGYGCYYNYSRKGGPACQCMSARVIDEAVTKLFLSVVTPAKIDIALQALKELDGNRQEACRQWELQLQQADYGVELARRRYESTDPENRLVTGELESHWEDALRQRERLKQQYAEFQRSQDQTVRDQDCQLIKELANDLPLVWNAPTTSMQERKTLLRFLINRVHLDGVSEKGKIRIEVQWHTGARSSLKVDRPLMGVWAPKTPEKALRRIEELWSHSTYAEIAKKLNQEGFKTAKGLRFGASTVGYIVRSRGWKHKSG
jgi:DNA invertase Pin-like site-specific DNA recombinase